MKITHDKNNLLDRAQQIADQRRADECVKEAQERARAERLQVILKKMIKLVLAELKKIDGRSSKYGAFKLDTEKDGAFNVFAKLYAGDEKVAWFKAQVVSGERALSDDCTVDYTEPLVWARFYRPNLRRPKHDGMWDTQELRDYANGGVHRNFVGVDDEATKVFFEHMAEHLAAWL